MTEKSAKSQKQIKKEDFDIKEIYTPLSVAKKEIWRRWNDKELKKKVEDFLGGDVPKFLKNEPKAILARDIASPDLEFRYFLELTKEIKLEPICYEYMVDKFVAGNSDKYHLCKMFFYEEKGKDRGSKISTMRIVDFNESEGKSFRKIKTLWGENFVNFHHRILKAIIPNAKFVDASSRNQKNGKMSKNFYLSFLSLFVCHAVLFENFLLNEEEIEFTKNRVIPTIKKIKKTFGVKPLIIPLAPREDEDNLYWWCYPEKIRKIINYN